MKKETDILSVNLNNAKSLDDFFEENKNAFVKNGIGEYISSEITKRKISKSRIIRDSGINKRYFMDILSDKKIPIRRYVIRIFLSLGIKLDDVQWYLKACNYNQLYVRNKYDCVIIYCINNKLSVKQCNQMLNQIGQENLGFENI